jgi:hypothetical protein
MEEDEEVEVENANDDDDEQSHEEDVEVEPHPLKEYPNGQRDVSVLTQNHLHVAYRMSEGVVRFYNLNFFVLCKLKVMFIFIYAN